MCIYFHFEKIPVELNKVHLVAHTLRIYFMTHKKHFYLIKISGKTCLLSMICFIEKSEKMA